MLRCPPRATRLAWRCAAVLVTVAATGRPAAAQDAPLIIRQLSFEGNRALDDLTLAAAIGTTNSSTFARLPVLRGLGLGEKRTFNEQEFRRDVARLQALYRRAGYRDVTVDTSVVRTAKDVYITVRIAEGRPLRLATLAIVGLDSLEEREKLVRDLPIAEGDVFSRFALSAARDTILARLWEAGYQAAASPAPRFEEDVAQYVGSATLQFRPGRAMVFGDVRVYRVSGGAAVDSGFIASLVSARAGTRYRHEELYRSQRNIYGSELFRFVSVEVDTARMIPGDSVVPLAVGVIEGRAHRARASIGFATNDCFRTGAGWTARDFLGTGRLLDITGRLSKIGVGDPLDFGAANSLCSPLRDDSVGSRVANYALTASARRTGFLSPDNVLTLSLFTEKRSEYKVFLREEFGASASITRETARRIPVTLTYRVALGRTSANPASFCAFFNACVGSDIARLQERRVLATLGLSAERVRVNNFLDPTRGTILTAEVLSSSKYFGSSSLQQFTRVVGEASGFVPLTRTVTLAGHVRLGAIFSPKVDLQSGRQNFVPPEQRFYAGGPNDVRGYDRNELGPVVYVVPADSVDDAGDFPETAARISAIGGNRTAVTNLELRLPSPIFAQRVRFAVFTDVGALWDGEGRARFRMTPGGGIRIASPLGPIRFDVGYNRYDLESGAVYTTNPDGDLVLLRERFVRDRTRRITLHFSVGQAF